MGNESSTRKGRFSGIKRSSKTGGADKKATSPTAASGSASSADVGAAAVGAGAKGGKEPRKSSLTSQVAENSSKNKVTLKDFVLIKTVGKGSFGKVIQVKKKDTGQIYAMKVLKKEQVIRRKQFEHTMAERRILEEIDHPFIVSLRFAFQTTQKLYMVFDFFNGGELFHYLSKGGRFSEDRARLYAAEIALGLEHVHSMNIIYRDLKPENLLLDADGHIRITDFGLSKENVFDDDVKSFCGTPEYLAPEVLKRQKYGKAVDWWSLGTLLYEMISGLPPYYDRNRERMYKKVSVRRVVYCGVCLLVGWVGWLIGCLFVCWVG
jgi:serum/glucocorticoid-regulated kinase 2